MSRLSESCQQPRPHGINGKRPTCWDRKMLGLWRTFFLCTDWSLGGWDSGWDWLVQSCHLHVLVSLPQYGISKARCLEMRPQSTLSWNAALQPVASNSVPLEVPQRSDASPAKSHPKPSAELLSAPPRHIVPQDFPAELQLQLRQALKALRQGPGTIRASVVRSMKRTNYRHRHWDDYLLKW